MGLLVGFGDYGVGDMVARSEEIYQMLLDLCQDKLSWENVLNKPDLYTTDEVYNKQEIDDKLADIAPGEHTHTIAQIDGLQDELDDRYTKEQTNDKLDEKAEKIHTHEVSDIEGLTEAIAAAGVQIVSALPPAVTDGKIYMLKPAGSNRFQTFITVGGAYVPLDAVTYSALATALGAYQLKFQGLATQYVKGDGTLGEFTKEAIGLGLIPNTAPANWPISTAQQNINASKANDSEVLKKAGSQTKTSGVLTFVESPEVPTPVNGTDAVNKIYVDNALAETETQTIPFETAAVSWTWTHNQNRYYDIEVYVNNRKVTTSVENISLNESIIYFKRPQSGYIIAR